MPGTYRLMIGRWRHKSGTLGGRRIPSQETHGKAVPARQERTIIPKRLGHQCADAMQRAVGASGTPMGHASEAHPEAMRKAECGVNRTRIVAMGPVCVYVQDSAHIAGIVASCVHTHP
jgi:hypothetical protein